MTQEKQPTPESSLKLAESMNQIAGDILKISLPLEQRETDSNKGQISLGLSLQAAELAGKAMLRTIGWSKGKIRKHFNDHNLYKLLEVVESELKKSSNRNFNKFSDFLFLQPTIDDVKFGNTIGHYLKSHFDKPNSSPRNYFYSDHPTFLAPKPFNAVHVIAEILIKTTKGLASA